MRGDGDALIDLDLSPDGRTLAFMENDGTLRFVDTRTRRRGGARRSACRATRLRHRRDRPLRPAALQPRRVADRGRRLRAGHPRRRDPSGPRASAGRQRPSTVVSDLRFSPDGRTLYAVGGLPADAAQLVLAVRRAHGPPARPARFATRPRRLREQLMPTRDGRALVTADSAEGETVIRDARTLRVLRRMPVGAQYTALSPDGRTLLLGGADGSVRFVDLRTGKVRLASGTPQRRRRARHLQRRRALRHHRRHGRPASSCGTSARRGRARPSPATTAGSPRWRSAGTARRSTAARWTARS